ncbi:alpha/beta-hydrolase [Peniophora sp. CONT]|nr:alpha/beta-hydrolase [Peniophora sp. CONT]
MMAMLDKYGRVALDVASAGSSLGFAAAKAGTSLGFMIARGITSTAAHATGAALDLPFGGRLGAGDALGNTINAALNYMESLALLPLTVGESLTSASLVAAYSAVNTLSTLFPGTDEASFSLASFVSLVRREWENPASGEHGPEEKFGVGEVAQALVAWGALQHATSDWQLTRWRPYLREIPFHDSPASSHFPSAAGFDDGTRSRQRTESKISITGDVRLAGRQGQLVTADITELDANGKPVLDPSDPLIKENRRPERRPLRQSTKALKHTLRRLSKMVLAGYGGASLLFFGVDFGPGAASTTTGETAKPQDAELAKEGETLQAAVDESEKLAPDGDGASSAQAPKPPGYSWWDVLMGRHDHDIFLHSVRSHAMSPSSQSERPPSPTSHQPHMETFSTGGGDGISAVVGLEERMPRYWVLTDHTRRQIVLVFRGTMSLNELAVDLTCDPAEFEPASSDEPGPSYTHTQPRTSSSYRQPVPTPQHPYFQATGSEAQQRPDIDGLPVEVQARDFEYEFGAPSDNEHSMPGGLPSPSISTASRQRTKSARSTRKPPARASTVPFPDKPDNVEGTRPERMRSASFASVGSFHESYEVHGGMLTMARIMGAKGAPVHEAVRGAMKSCKGYELVMCGHSLGSGVAALLGMMWADPKTCLTVRSSGLPVGRRVSVYCFGPPCLTDARLSKLAENMVTSFVYSHDVVSRLSLGSIRDMNRAAAWLCQSQAEGAPEGYASITKRALKHATGFGTRSDPTFFLSVRKTLEANMRMAHLYPPGRVLWAVRAADFEIPFSDIHASPENKYRVPHEKEKDGAPRRRTTGSAGGEELKLYEVLDVEAVFGQIVFARDMLSAHLPHQYDRVLEALL